MSDEGERCEVNKARVKAEKDLDCFACKFTEQHKYEINKLRHEVIVTFLNPQQKSS